MARIKREPVMWPSWRHGPNGELELFNSPEEVPEGWTRTAAPAYEATGSAVHVDRDEVVAQLEKLGITVDPTWGKAHLKKVLDDSSTAR